MEVIQGFKDLLLYDSVTCAISDCMGRFNAMTLDMRPVFEGIRLVGTAITVKTLAADLAAAYKAIDICQPGDIVALILSTLIKCVKLHFPIKIKLLKMTQTIVTPTDGRKTTFFTRM